MEKEYNAKRADSPEAEVHSQLIGCAGDPERVSHANAEATLGRHVTSDVRGTGNYDRASQEACKTKKFTRGGEARVPYPGVSGRDWSPNDAGEGEKH
jgi:hypothetical protein